MSGGTAVGAMRARRWPALVATAVVAVAAVVLAVYLVWLRQPAGEYQAAFRAEGVAPVTVTVPRPAGRPAITARPNPPAETVPAATRLLSRPVHVETGAFAGDARIEMTYDPASLPAGAQPGTDLMVLTFVPDLNTWLPAGTQVDPARHTVAASTRHFSDWVLAVTDPRELADEQALERRLRSTAGGRLGALLTGDDDTLGCDPALGLLPARFRSDLTGGLRVKLCEQPHGAGAYRLQWVNTTGLPVRFDLPAGFETESEPDVDVQVQRMIGGDGRYVLPGDSLTLTFGSGALPDNQPAPVLTGAVDWGLYFLVVEQEIVEAALLDEEGSNAKLRKALERAFISKEAIDCSQKAAAKLQRSTRDLQAALATGFRSCLTAVVDVVWQGARVLLSGVKNVLAGWIARRGGAILAIPKLMELARSEIAGIPAAVYSSFGVLDTSVSIMPTRVLTHAEAVRLTLTQETDEPDPQEPCRQFRSGQYLPAGMTDAALCVQSIALDLDGNGDPDRLITWRPRLSAGLSDSLAATRIGAVAYLDDGSYHVLANPPTGWGSSFQPGLNLFHFHAAVHLGADRRTQAVIATQIGANTFHAAVLGLGPDSALRAIALAGGPAPVVDVTFGGGAGSATEYGCVLTGGRPAFVQRGMVTDFSTGSYEWDREFYRFDGRQLVRLGHDQGTAADERAVPGAGSDCSTADPARRGPAVTP